MKNHISRRDFLKLAGLLPFTVAAPRLINSLAPVQQTGQAQNVVILVFDAFSAHNISLYGYQRETTPNLARLADKAVIYHNHYAGGNFTTPGTASLLTGALPWTHRAFHNRETVQEALIEKNIFAAFQNYHQLFYSHNPLVNVFMEQFKKSIDEPLPRDNLFLKKGIDPLTLFESDEDIATVSWVRAMRNREEGYAYSLFLSHLFNRLNSAFEDKLVGSLGAQFPRGLPNIADDSYYLLEDAIDWLNGYLVSLPQPFLCYLHFLPPHAPYRTHQEFYDRFKNDLWQPEPKPLDVFASGEDLQIEKLLSKRTSYDEFVLYVDREFGRLFDYLDSSDLLENTWVVLTSDHGEMFERGISGHKTPVLYNPVIRIPLMIFEPGRKARADVHTPTSAVDILPTLLHVTRQQAVDWGEGIVLPPFSDSYQAENRNVYAMESKKNGKYQPLTIATTTLIKAQFKLIYFFGYNELGSGKERIELYDLERDPEETNNLYTSKRETASEMLHELKMKLAEVDEPYR
jgi:arylsulfatase A-like enzyme